MLCLGISLFLWLFFTLSEASLKWSDTYHLKAIATIPSAQVTEPYEIWVDGKYQRVRVDFYDGMDIMFREVSKENKLVYYKVYPKTTEDEDNKITCKKLNLNSSLMYMFLTNTYLPKKNYKFIGNETIDNIVTQKWEAVVNNKNLKSGIVYTVWVTFGKSSRGLDVPVPIRYEYRITFNNSELEYVRHDYIHYDDSALPSNKLYEIRRMNCSEDAALEGPIDPLMEMTDPMIEDQTVNQQFEEYKLKHNKKYVDLNEHEKRKAIFKNNLRFINSENRQHKSYTLGLNHLADLSDEEMLVFSGTLHKPPARTRVKHTGRNNEGRNGFNEHKNINKGADEEGFDWRDYGAITPIKDQTPFCGSCYAFTVAAAVESSAYISRGCKSLVELSEQAIVDCTWGDSEEDGDVGCGGGTYEYALDWILRNGLPIKEDYGPYLAQEGFCHMKNMTKLVVPADYEDLMYPSNSKIKGFLRRYGPMLASINITPKSFSFYKHGVYDDIKCRSEENQRNHGVALIGYGKHNSADYWIIKNSYGKMWGEDGYIRLKAHNNICGVKNFLNYVKFNKNNSKKCFKTM